MELSMELRILSMESLTSSGLILSMPEGVFILNLTVYVPPWAKPVIVIYLSRGEHEHATAKTMMLKKKLTNLPIIYRKAKYLYKGRGFSN